jgi:hypothetical protein
MVSFPVHPAASPNPQACRIPMVASGTREITERARPLERGNELSKVSPEFPGIPPITDLVVRSDLQTSFFFKMPQSGFRNRYRIVCLSYNEPRKNRGATDYPACRILFLAPGPR